MQVVDRLPPLLKILHPQFVDIRSDLNQVFNQVLVNLEKLIYLRPRVEVNNNANRKNNIHKEEVNQLENRKLNKLKKVAQNAERNE